MLEHEGTDSLRIGNWNKPEKAEVWRVKLPQSEAERE